MLHKNTGFIGNLLIFIVKIKCWFCGVGGFRVFFLRLVAFVGEKRAQWLPFG
jgi:hypothetical protein